MMQPRASSRRWWRIQLHAPRSFNHASSSLAPMTLMELTLIGVRSIIHSSFPLLLLFFIFLFRSVFDHSLPFCFAFLFASSFLHLVASCLFAFAEYPVDPDQGGRPQDKQNFVSLLAEFRAAIEAESVPSLSVWFLFCLCLVDSYFLSFCALFQVASQNFCFRLLLLRGPTRSRMVTILQPSARSWIGLA